jgi:predicted Rossmann-fold nucleotide-binding protein
MPKKYKGKAGKPQSKPFKKIAKPKVRKLIEIATSAGSHKPGSRGTLRKHLDERLRLLNQRTMLIEQELRNLENNRFYRVCIFGSARIKPDTKGYNDVFKLARYLAWQNIDILTGGGPGLMEAANKGAQLGQQEKNSKSLSYGISIELDFEPTPNMHLDVKRHHHKFSSRLDDFMRLSHSIIVTPGGIGTALELFFSWQLIQVKHLSMRPLVLMDGEYWSGLIAWMKDFPLTRNLVSATDFDCIKIIDTPEEAVEIITKDYESFLKNRGKLAPLK